MSRYLAIMHKFMGKSQTTTCMMDPARAAALHATLGLPDPPPAAGDALPAFWHQIYFWDTQTPENLGRDGHPKIGDFIPDLGLPRRMWAGGQHLFHTPLLTGTPAKKTTLIESITEKSGRSGPLAFVTLRHEISQSGKPCVTEHQDLVYRQDPDPTTANPIPPMARTDETDVENHSFSTTLLFRYSALTMNGHRIHYDAPYAQNIEGYNGLVTHGPLLAQYLMRMAERHLGPLNNFKFRASSPLMQHETAAFCINGNKLWVRAADGRECMQATAG